MKMRKLPTQMKLGAATAAYQVEGGYNAADKSLSIWDTFCKLPGKVEDNSTANDSCKSYEFYKRDVQMLKFLGVDFYRFSVSWPRILPDGFTNRISKAGLEYYNNLINELLANGIEPYVTLYHWDLPQKLQDLGGWANPLIAQWFEDYARIVYEAFGDRVKTWITLNEPKQFGIYGYGTPKFAPDVSSAGIGDYIVVKNMLLAHARAWHLYDKEFRPTQKGTCSITIATDLRVGESDTVEDVETGALVMDFEVGLFGHPIFSCTGDFPERVKRRVAQKSAAQGYPRSRLPVFSKEEIEYIKGTSDFFGFNHYSTMFFTETKYKPGMFPIPSMADDIGAVGSYKDYKPAPIPHATSIPYGMRQALNWVKDNYNNIPVMITENGYGDFGGLKDSDRMDYYKKYLDAVLDAIELDGCDVRSYTAWSLMDNFEWDSGFTIKFGIFHVDFEDEKRPRTAKGSAFWYKNLCETRTLNPCYEPVIKKLTF